MRIAKINESKSRYLEKINKIDKSLARLMKKKKKIKRERERTQINKIRNEKGEVKMDSTEIENIIRDHHKQLYTNKMDLLEEIDKFVQRYKLPRLKQE